MLSIPRKALAVLGLLLLLAQAAVAAPAKPAAPQVLPSVMELRIAMPDGRTATATAFLAVKDGLAVTSLHAVRDAKSVTARFSNGEEFECSGLVDVDEKRNVALLRIKLFGRPVLPLKAVEPAAGSKAWFASTGSRGFGVAATTVQAPLVEGGVKYLPLTPSLSPETSGGALLNARGEVLGVIAIRTVDGRSQFLAIPAAYVLALDPALPTRPWPAAAAQATQDAPSDDALDRLLAEGMVNCLDLLSAYRYADRTTGGSGFLQGVPLILYQARQTCETSLAALTAARSEDPLRQRMLARGRKVHDGLIKSTDLLIQSVVLGQAQKEWGAGPKDQWSRSQALIQATIAPDPEYLADTKQLFQGSAAFRAAMPAEGALTLGITNWTAGYRFGIDSFSRNPFALLLVVPDSFAARLGFQQGDVIRSVGGREFKVTDTTDELQLLLKAHLGEKIPAVVERNGKTETLTLDLPKEIPAEFLVTP